MHQFPKQHPLPPIDIARSPLLQPWCSEAPKVNTIQKHQGRPVRPFAKMVPTSSSQPSTPCSAKPPQHTQPFLDTNSESDSDIGSTQTVIHSGMFKQFKLCMLQKALKQTSNHITDKLTREIWELGQRTAELEVRVDIHENHTQDHTAELENLREENLVLQSHLEDQENGGRHSNLRIRGSLGPC